MAPRHRPLTARAQKTHSDNTPGNTTHKYIKSKTIARHRDIASHTTTHGHISKTEIKQKEQEKKTKISKNQHRKKYVMGIN